MGGAQTRTFRRMPSFMVCGSGCTRSRTRSLSRLRSGTLTFGYGRAASGARDNVCRCLEPSFGRRTGPPHRSLCCRLVRCCARRGAGHDKHDAAPRSPAVLLHAAISWRVLGVAREARWCGVPVGGGLSDNGRHRTVHRAHDESVRAVRAVTVPCWCLVVSWACLAVGEL